MPRLILMMLILGEAGAIWPFSSESTKPEFSLSEYAAGEWTFTLQQSQSSPTGFAAVKNWTVALTAVQEGSNVAFMDSLKKRRIVFDGSVVKMVPPSVPQPSKHIEIKAPPPAGDDEDEFEEFESSKSAASGDSSAVGNTEEFKWAEEEAELDPLTQLRFFEPVVENTPLGSRVAFGHFLSDKIPAFYHLLLTAGRVSLTVELERGGTGTVEDQNVRTVLTIFGVKGQGAASGKVSEAQAGWFGTYGPTAIIVGFWVVSWLQGWAKKNPMIQKAWKLAEEQAKEMQQGKTKGK
jgi:hypothetical protein